MLIHEIDSKEAYKKLTLSPKSILLDVRTNDEWRSTGVPDLTSINKQTVLLEWPRFVNKEFINFFKTRLISSFNFEDDLIFICRSGVRSRLAAEISVKFGFANVCNILDGFEGINNSVYNGWKKNDLPWKAIND